MKRLSFLYVLLNILRLDVRNSRDLTLQFCPIRPIKTQMRTMSLLILLPHVANSTESHSQISDTHCRKSEYFPTSHKDSEKSDMYLSDFRCLLFLSCLSLPPKTLPCLFLCFTQLLTTLLQLQRGERARILRPVTICKQWATEKDDSR